MIEQKSIFHQFQGKQYNIDSKKSIQLHFELNNSKLFLGNSIDWLTSLADDSIDLVIADPPYNIKKAHWDNFRDQEEYILWSEKWISEVSRILKKEGSFYIFGFSEIIADIKYRVKDYFPGGCKWLIWHYKNKANMSNDWGRSHETILHFRKSKKTTFNIDSVRIPYSKHTLKYPKHPQAETSQYGNGKSYDWSPNPLGAKPKDVIDIPTTCNGMNEKTQHPTQKPEELIRKLVLASSNVNDVVLDPFSGSGTTLVVAEQLNRKWLGCELEVEYNEWAINRLKQISVRGENNWLEIDRKTKERRESIR